MAGRHGQGRTPYYSSDDKNLVREKFDLPLVEAAARKKEGKIRYFGLPGEAALDLQCWGRHCDYVAAVEFSKEKFHTVKHVLRTQFGSIRHRAHLGDVDKVILRNKSGRPPTEFVSTTNLPEVGFIWDFDVIYLDYFGKFLPYERGSAVVQNRANALRKLFAPDRQDGWQPWLLMLTVESRLFGADDKEQMRQFLSASKEEADEETQQAIDFLLDETVSTNEQAARLVHGTLSYILAVAAGNSDVRVCPKPTIRYRGANGTPMLHFAYEVVPAGLLSGSHPALPLLRSPLLRVRDDHADPWFELLPSQPPGQTISNLRATLDFLTEGQIEQIV